MATMKIRVVNPYKEESEETMALGDNTYKHTHNYVECLDITHDGQHFYLFWDEERNALKIIDTSNDGKLCVFPSSNNAILIQIVKQ